MKTYDFAVWTGGLKDGKGSISTQSGALKALSPRLLQPLSGFILRSASGDRANAITTSCSQFG